MATFNIGQDTTTFTDALKEFYLPGVQETLPNQVVALSRFEKNTNLIDGKYARIAFKTGYTPVGSVAERAALPPSGNAAIDDAQISVKYTYAPVEFTGQVVRASRTGYGSFINAITLEMKAAVESLRKNLNRQIMLDGQGILAEVNASGSITTSSVPLDDPGGITTSSNVGARYIHRGMKLNAYTSGGSLRSGVMTVTGLSLTANPQTMKVDTLATGLTNGDLLRTVNSTSTSEMTGLYAFCVSTTNTVQTIDKSDDDNYWFRPYVLSNSGTLRPVAVSMIQQLESGIEQNSGSAISALYMSYALRDILVEFALANQRYVQDDLLNAKMGHKMVEINGLPLIPDREMISHHIYGVDESTFEIFTLIPELVDWLQEDDGGIIKRLEDYDIYKAVLAVYANLGCYQGNANGAISDLIET